MSFNQSMNITLGSMKNNQYALTVVSQNIANIHVDGYHRQRVNFVTNEYTTNCENVISTIKGMNGASISELTNYIDQGAFDGLLGSNSDSEYYKTLVDSLGELEGLADDLGDNGLNGLLNEFFKASANLEQFPADMTIRQQYVLAAQNVCEKFNQLSGKYENIQEDKFKTVSNEVNEVNKLLSELAQANELHVKHNQSAETKANINGILEKLSNYMDIKTDTNENGTVNVYAGNIALVSGNEQMYTLEADFDSTQAEAVKFSLRSTENPAYVITDDVTSSFKKGSLGAHIAFLNGEGGKFANLNDMRGALDHAASAFGDELNKIQTYDDGTNFAASITTGADGNLILEKATEAMFTTKDGSKTLTASNIQVNANIVDDPFKISAARINMDKYKDPQGNEDPNWIKAVGNSDNATEITALQNKNICSFDGVNKNCTLSEFLRTNAAQNGMDLANIEDKAKTAQDILNNDITNYSNLIGVNLDEELSDMLRYQRAYEASARLFSTIDSLIQTVINMV